MPVEQAPLLEVRVLRDYDQSVQLGILPNLGILRVAQPNRAHVNATGVKVSQEAGQTGREVLIEEQPHHGSVASLRSRSAAKARQARTSSAVRSGNSASNSS